MKLKPGVAFSDHIKTEKIVRRNYSSDSHFRKNIPVRTLALPFFMVVLLVILIGRLFIVQVVQGTYYRSLADNNRIRTRIVHAPRGIIFDRNNIPLVFNIPGFRAVNSNNKKSGETTFLTQDQALEAIASGKENIEIDSLRKYPYAEATSHVLGYIGEITKEELEDPLYKNYQGGNVIGKFGIEGEYETKLAGKDGKELIEVDAYGKPVRTLGQSDPTPGENIPLTLDIKLQEASYKALSGIEKGTVIVSTPKGEILALVSKPSFDSNLFTLGKEYKTATDAAYTSVSKILTDNENQPMLNRAISGTYPPGSTFKLITSAAALERNIIDEKYFVEDTGILKVGEFSFANWYFTQYGRTEGDVNVVAAIKRSNDIFFYKIGAMIGVDNLAQTARQFGLGKQLGIDLPGEAKGLVPDEEWKQKTLGESWYLGDNYHYGIGQGYLLTTPLQVNGLTQVVANEGMLYQPHLLKNQESRIMNQGVLTKKTTDLIRQGMIESCQPTGVAWPLFNFRVKNQELRSKIDNKNYFEPQVATGSAVTKDDVQISVACKTGTAQHGGEKTLPHSWITLFAPAYNPQIVVTVLAESSGEGSNIAGPIAKKVLEAWFSR